MLSSIYIREHKEAVRHLPPCRLSMKAAAVSTEPHGCL